MCGPDAFLGELSYSYKLSVWHPNSEYHHLRLPLLQMINTLASPFHRITVSNANSNVRRTLIAIEQ